MRHTHLALLACTLTGCTRPPPAPEGLDDSVRYLMRHYWSDDATFEAGIEGLMTWFELGDPSRDEEPGRTLVGLVPGEGDKTTDAFQLGALQPSDVAALPLRDPIILDPGNMDDPADDLLDTRDLGEAAGIISISQMDCTWVRTEMLLTQQDQSEIFPLDWDSYERIYLSDLDAYQRASSDLTFDPIRTELAPYAEGFDADPYARSVLLTDNRSDPSSVLGIDLPAFDRDVAFRHGTFDIRLGGESRSYTGFVSLIFNRDAMWSPNGANGAIQFYALDINLGQEDGTNLRIYAGWVEAISPFLAGSDSPLALQTSIRKARDASELLSSICSNGDDAG